MLLIIIILIIALRILRFIILKCYGTKKYKKNNLILALIKYIFIQSENNLKTIKQRCLEEGGLIFESDLYKSNQGHWINYTAILLCLLILNLKIYSQSKLQELENRLLQLYHISIPIVNSDTLNSDTLKIESKWSTSIDFLPIAGTMVDSSGNKKLILYQNYTAINLLALFDEYAEECYNDSMEKCFNYFYYMGEKYKSSCTKYDNDLGINAGYMGSGKEWIHKEPTLKGFREFLRKKINCSKGE